MTLKLTRVHPGRYYVSLPSGTYHINKGEFGRWYTETPKGEVWSSDSIKSARALISEKETEHGS